MKKILFCLGCFVISLIIISCAGTKVENTENEREDVIIGMANPFHDCNSLEDAAKITGFSITLPNQQVLPEWVTKTVYRATNVEKNLLEIIYYSDEVSYTKEIRIRKAQSEEKDISGDFNSYEKEEETEIGGQKVTVKTNGNKIYLVNWNKNDFSYSLRVSDGMDKNQIAKLVDQIN